MDNPTPSTERSEDTLFIEIGRLARLFARELVPSDLADDVSQDVVLTCLVKLRSGTLALAPVTLVAFVKQMARQRAIDCLRQEGKGRARDEEYGREIDMSPHIWMLPDATLDADELLALHRRTLDRLSPRCRRAYVMVREERTTYKIVAQRLGVSRGIVCASVVAAQRQFRVGLLEHGIALAPHSRSRARHTRAGGAS